MADSSVSTPSPGASGRLMQPPDCTGGLEIFVEQEMFVLQHMECAGLGDVIGLSAERSFAWAQDDNECAAAFTI